MKAMLENLKAKNPGLPIYSVESEEFRPYGRVLTDLDTAPILSAAASIENPESGAKYVPSEPLFEALPLAKEICDRYFGCLPTQTGYCWGCNDQLNATEWHTCSEVNIGITPVVLLLAHRWQIVNGKIDASAFKAFYLPKGMAIEVYATSLHFTPCQAQKGGFGCVVVLPEGTNTALDAPSDDKLLTNKNKWLICHEENQRLIDRGFVPGITGENITVHF